VYRAKICCTSFSDLFEIMTLNMCHKFVLLIHLRHAVTLTFEPFTLNVCILSVVTWSNPVPNFSEIEQCAAELLRFKYVQFVRRPPSWISLEVDFHSFATSEDYDAQTYQISTQ